MTQPFARPADLLEKAFKHHQGGRLREAEELYAAFVAAQPKHADGWYLYGTVALQMGQHAAAIERLRKAVRLNDRSAPYLVNLGQAYQADGQPDLAVARFRDAARVDGAFADAHANLGAALLAKGRAGDALTSYRRALQLDPGNARAHYNVGVAAQAAVQLDDAAQALRDAARLDVTLVQAQANLGVVLHDLGDHAGAEVAYERALQLNPAEPETLNNFATLRRDQACFPEALELFARAVASRTDFAEAHHNRSLLHLLREEYSLGWAEYEWRWRCAHMVPSRRPFAQPRWQGEALSSGSLLVWGEQGIGDEILYAGMLHDLMARGIRVAWEADARLVPLLQRSYPDVAVFGRKTPPAVVDVVAQIPAGSLGQHLRPDLTSFPNDKSYLRADSSRGAAFRAQLGVTEGERLVGISWISRNPHIGAHKTTPLAAWGDVLRVPGVRFVDLQYGDTRDERAAAGLPLAHVDGLDLRDDLDGLAALVAACDLVVTVSNTTAHLAGALGVPTWILLPAGAGKLWYWGHGRDTTPWYPSVRLVRQGNAGDWGDTLATVAARLRGI